MLAMMMAVVLAVVPYAAFCQVAPGRLTEPSKTPVVPPQPKDGRPAEPTLKGTDATTAVPRDIPDSFTLGQYVRGAEMHSKKLDTIEKTVQQHESALNWAKGVWWALCGFLGGLALVIAGLRLVWRPLIKSAVEEVLDLKLIDLPRKRG